MTGQHSQPEWAAHWTGRLTLLQAHSGLYQRWEFHTGTARLRVGDGGKQGGEKEKRRQCRGGLGKKRYALE